MRKAKIIGLLCSLTSLRSIFRRNTARLPKYRGGNWHGFRRNTSILQSVNSYFGVLGDNSDVDPIATWKEDMEDLHIRYYLIVVYWGDE